MDGPGSASIYVVGFARPGGEHPVLEEEGLVPWHSLLEEVSFPSLFLSTETILVKGGIELLLGLTSDIVVKVVIPISDVFLQVDLTRMDLPLEQ